MHSKYGCKGAHVSSHFFSRARITHVTSSVRKANLKGGLFSAHVNRPLEGSVEDIKSHGAQK